MARSVATQKAPVTKAIPVARASKLLLREVPLFSELSDTQLDSIAEVIQRRTFARGSSILKAGDNTASLYVVLQGKVQVLVSNRHGEEVILDILGPGDYFGEMGLIDDLPRSATVNARERCEILILSKRDFHESLKDNGKLAMALHRGLARRLRAANAKIGSLALLDVRGRIAKLLLDMAKAENGALVVRGLTRQDIAKLVGASREMASRTISSLQEQGYIAFDGAAIILLRAKPAP